MHYCADQASDCQVAQIAGVESELELPFAALHQLCTPLLKELPPLPEPQERALRVALGLADGSIPGRFLVGLAVLSSLAEVAAKRPLVCLVDDAQWLDEASSQVLGFVGRRLLAESVLLVFAVREESDVQLFEGLPTLALEGLSDDDARDLLTATVSGQLDAQVRDRIIAETGGNPLSLLELPRAMSAAELAGGFAVPPTATLSGHLQDLYVRRLLALPEPTRQLMLLAATDPTGDATLLWRAAQTLGVTREAAEAAETEKLLDISSRVKFRHPVVRSAVQAVASPAERRAAHLAIASVTDAQQDPDRRIWHLAAAATGPDKDLAAELERSAGRAQDRAGLAAAAAFLQRSAALTPSPRLRADRILAAAHAHLHAGAFGTALSLLAEAEAAAVDELQGAQVDLLRGQVDRAASAGREAPVRLLQAARKLESLDIRLALNTYLDAAAAAAVAGGLARLGGRLIDVVTAAQAAPPPPAGLQSGDYLLEGLAVSITAGPAAAAPALRRAVDGILRGQLSPDQWFHWGILASMAALSLWDYETWTKLSARQAEVARSSGALAPLATALNLQRVMATLSGDLELATSLGVEEDALKKATGTSRTSYGALVLAAYRGRADQATRLIAKAADEALARGEGLGQQSAYLATAILNNGLGRYTAALTAALRSVQEDYVVFTRWGLAEVVESAARSGRPELADDALQRLTDVTLKGSDWAAAIAARSRALLSKGTVADSCYLEAVERFARTPLRPELARAHLLYGEWLRREDRRLDAREQLRTAHDLFTEMGAEAFAERARRELLAVGDSVRRRKPDAQNGLTAQELHIARLARDGRTNGEIGEELYLSARTVEWHLRKVFAKLHITSRRGLQDALPTR
ncbi:LuxR family transcriptional regulator [Kribbella alba]|uniref:LuxR family transcriptional regulator n=2 Tax=Kribbella alba TaxID=190197 RepID=A0ABP4RDV8_9ACTN